MADHPLSPEEGALWARVIASVRPIERRAARAIQPPRPKAVPGPVAVRAPSPVRAQPPAPPSVKATPPADTLDGGWDRRLARGTVAPDLSVDLHGHTLASAYAVLDSGLERAIRGGARVMLLVTGKPPRVRAEGGPVRGAIRAAVGDWLAASRHADAIAAVRGAHPRHGGAGALYIILRRKRGAS